MDRLTTGRRRVRAGSVHVTELIKRQAARTGPPAPLAAPTTPAPGRTAARPTAATRVLATRTSPAVEGTAGGTAERPVPDPIETSDPIEFSSISYRRPPSRGAQLAKLTSLGAATLVLCGAVAAASMISHQRADDPAAERPSIRVTGDQALLPDQLERTLPSAGDAAARPAAKEPAPPAAPSAPEPAAAAERPAPPATPTSEARTATPSAAPPMSDVALVETFYDLLPNDPDGAFALISPNLLSTTLGEFLESWSTVSGIEVVEVSEQAEGVVAVVRLTLADGGHLSIKQLLTVADAPRRITGVQLLSAQRN